MSKKQTSARVKGNLKPSSSAKAASVLSAVTPFPSATGTDSYIGFSSASGLSQQLNEEQSLDNDIRACYRQCVKKDSLTKLKALKSLQVMLDKKDETVCLDALQCWPRIFSKTSLDSDFRVREASQAVMFQFSEKAKKNLAPTLKSILPFWFLGQCDGSSTCLKTATEGFQGTFSSDKRPQVLWFCRKECIQEWSQLLLLKISALRSRSSKSLQSCDDSTESSEDRESRIFTCVLLSLSAFLDSLSEIPDPDDLEQLLEQDILGKAKFFHQFHLHKSENVKAAYFKLLCSLIIVTPRLISAHESKVINVVFTSLQSKSSKTAVHVFNSALLLLKDKDVWAHIKFKEVVLPKLNSLLRKGLIPIAILCCPSIAIIVDKFPDENKCESQMMCLDSLVHGLRGILQRPATIPCEEIDAMFKLFQDICVILINSRVTSPVVLDTMVCQVVSIFNLPLNVISRLTSPSIHTLVETVSKVESNMINLPNNENFNSFEEVLFGPIQRCLEGLLKENYLKTFRSFCGSFLSQPNLWPWLQLYLPSLFSEAILLYEKTASYAVLEFISDCMRQTRENKELELNLSDMKRILRAKAASSSEGGQMPWSEALLLTNLLLDAETQGNLELNESILNDLVDVFIVPECLLSLASVLCRRQGSGQSKEFLGQPHFQERIFSAFCFISTSGKLSSDGWHIIMEVLKFENDSGSSLSVNLINQVLLYISSRIVEISDNQESLETSVDLLANLCTSVFKKESAQVLVSEPGMRLLCSLFQLSVDCAFVMSPELCAKLRSAWSLGLESVLHYDDAYSDEDRFDVPDKCQSLKLCQMLGQGIAKHLSSLTTLEALSLKRAEVSGEIAYEVFDKVFKDHANFLPLYDVSVQPWLEAFLPESFFWEKSMPLDRLLHLSGSGHEIFGPMFASMLPKHEDSSVTESGFLLRAQFVLTFVSAFIKNCPSPDNQPVCIALAHLKAFHCFILSELEFEHRMQVSWIKSDAVKSLIEQLCEPLLLSNKIQKRVLMNLLKLAESFGGYYHCALHLWSLEAKLHREAMDACFLENLASPDVNVIKSLAILYSTSRAPELPKLKETAQTDKITELRLVTGRVFDERTKLSDFTFTFLAFSNIGGYRAKPWKRLVFDAFLEEKESLEDDLFFAGEGGINVTHVQLEFNLSLLLFLKGVLNMFEELTIDQQDFILCALVAWFQGVGSSQHILDESLQQTTFLQALCNFFCDIATLMEGGFDASGFESKETFEKLWNEWNNFFMDGCMAVYLPLFMKQAEATMRTAPNQAISVYSITTLGSLAKFCPKKHLEENRLSLLLSPDLDVMGCPEAIQSLVLHLTPSLQCQRLEIQYGAFILLNKIITNIPSAEVAKESTPSGDASDGSRVNVSGKPGEFNEEEETTFPTFLNDVIISSYEVLEREIILKSDICDFSQTARSSVFAYLLGWKLALRYCAKLKSEDRPRFSNYLRNSGLLDKLVMALFCLMPGSIGGLTSKKSADLIWQRPDDDSKSKTEAFSFSKQEPFSFSYSFGETEMEKLACYVFYDLLKTFPALVRQWWNNQNRKTSQMVERFTEKYLSPVLILEELQAVSDSVAKSEDMKIKTRMATREVVATYSSEDFTMELMVCLPTNHPLGAIAVDSGQRVGVAKEKWRKWMLQLTVFLMHQNGSLVDGILSWKRSVDKHMEGVEDCMVCMMTVHGSNYQLPRISCRQCKKKFHAECLYKWFNTSNKTNCPLCRTEF